ncbi:MAG TPA: phage holin family protein [Polyangia bacterium]|nr:phage holin family protein [Polyangia bacterium]
MYTILHLAALTATVLLLARIFPSVHVRSVGSAVVVAIVFSLLNFFLGWAVRLLLVVPAILTLGLLFLIFPFVVNTVLLWLTDKLLRSFEIETLGGLLASSAIITLVNGVLQVGLHAHRMGLYHNPGPVRWI